MTGALASLVLVPLVAALMARVTASRERARRLSLFATALVLVFAVVVFAIARRDDAFDRVDVVRGRALLGVHLHLGVDGLTSLLLPLAAAVSFVAHVVTPRGRLDGKTAARLLLAEAGILGCLVSLDVGLITFFLTLSTVPLILHARDARDPSISRAVWVFALGSLLPLAAATVLLGVVGVRAGSPTPLDLPTLSRLVRPGPLTSAVAVLVVVAASVRMGVLPLHGWLPVLFSRGPMHLVVVSLAAPVGSFLVARIVLPLVPDFFGRMGPVLGPLGALTAVHGALLAVGQHDLRRTLGFFAVSQSGFVLAGLAGRNAPSVSGALLLSSSTVVVVAGFLLVASAIDARASTVDMRRLGGLVVRAPRMATTFLLVSAAAVGFPGTIGFVTEDLLVQGLLRQHGLLAGTLLVVTAVNGVTLIRAFKRTFLGPPSRHADDLRSFPDFLRREQGMAVALVVVLLVGGFAAAPVLSVRAGLRGIVLAADEGSAHGREGSAHGR